MGVDMFVHNPKESFIVLKIMALFDGLFLIGLCINDEVALFKNTFLVLFSRKIINCVLV